MQDFGQTQGTPKLLYRALLNSATDHSQAPIYCGREGRQRTPRRGQVLGGPGGPRLQLTVAWRWLLDGFLNVLWVVEGSKP